jgi:winged helix DNA-binding protein
VPPPFSGGHLLLRQEHNAYGSIRRWSDRKAPAPCCPRKSGATASGRGCALWEQSGLEACVVEKPLLVSSGDVRNLLVGLERGDPPSLSATSWLVSILAERLTAQLLASSPMRDPVAVVERLLAIQAQDLRGARLAVRARSIGLSVAEVDRAFTEQRSLLVTWLIRGTLHVVRGEDYPWLQALSAPRLRTANARRLAQEGVPSDAAERGVAVIERA